MHYVIALEAASARKLQLVSSPMSDVGSIVLGLLLGLVLCGALALLTPRLVPLRLWDRYLTAWFAAFMAIVGAMGALVIYAMR